MLTTASQRGHQFLLYCNCNDYTERLPPVILRPNKDARARSVRLQLGTAHIQRSAETIGKCRLSWVGLGSGYFRLSDSMLRTQQPPTRLVCNTDHEPAYTPPPPPPPGGGGGGWFYHMVISGYLDHQSTQFRLSASELLLFVFVVLVLINALYGIPNCDDLVS